jgi:putative redox protein
MSTQDAENGIGMKPSDLLLVALGGCTSVDVISILQKKRQPVTGLEVSVSGEQETDPPFTFRKVHVVYQVRGRGLKAKAVEDAVALSEERYCSVGATVRAAAVITHEIQLIDETEAP